MTSTDSSETDSEGAQPMYAHIDVGCPVCGNTRFSSTEEGIPNGFDSHYVHVTCANCKTGLTIEYRAIDLFWYDSQDGQHSAVSQGLLPPSQTEYAEAGSYAPLPNQSLLTGLNWPLTCEKCGEHLTGNDIVTDSDMLSSHDIDIPDPEQVVFRCPNCEHIEFTEVSKLN